MARLLRIAILAGAALLLTRATPAQAQATQRVANGSFQVSAQVSAACTITAMPTLNFGTIDVTSTVPATVSSGNLSVRCTKTLSSNHYELRLSSASNFFLRNGPDDSLHYAISRVNNVAWTGGPFTFGSSGKTAVRDIPIEVTLDGGDFNVSAGSYSDTITAEIWF